MSLRRASTFGLLALGLASRLALGTDEAVGHNAPDLPPYERVQQALAALPEVQAAERLRDAAGAERDRLRVGMQEWQARVSTTRRTVSGAPDAGGPFQEWELALERPWRSRGKAEIDQRLGNAGVLHADNAVGDAEHEAARNLLRRWFAWRRAEDERTVLRAQREAWENTRQAVARRVEAGDAARLDLDLTEASRAQADARLAQAEGQAARAAIEFARAYPELQGNAPTGRCEPQLDHGTMEDQLDALLADNHELAMVQADLDRRISMAERVAADQHPDPLFGFRLASERGGAEHLAGVVVTLPIGGEGRAAALRTALAEVDAARARVMQVRRRLEGELLGQSVSARSLHGAWRASADSLERSDAARGRVSRAYALGEAGLAELLASQRQQQDAQLNESGLRNDACEAYYRLKLDSHALWASPDEAEATPAAEPAAKAALH